MSDFYFVVGASRPKSSGLMSIPVHAHMFFEKVNFSHIHMEFPAGLFTNETVYFEARNGQVNFVNEDTFLKKTEVVRRYMVYCNEAEVADIIDFCWRYCGINYGYGQLAGAVISQVMEYANFELKNLFADGMQTEICSSVATRLLHLCGVETIGDVESKTPKEVVSILERQGFERLS